jgi:acyl carrier protein
MTREDVQQKLIEMAAEQAGVAASEITPATHFHNDLNFDSLDDVEYAMKVEDEFSLSVADEDVEKLQTIEAVRDYVVSHTETAQTT